MDAVRRPMQRFCLALLGLPLLLGACAAGGQARGVGDREPHAWPAQAPAPLDATAQATWPAPAQSRLPTFTAPSATHCARPPTAHEWRSGASARPGTADLRATAPARARREDEARRADDGASAGWAAPAAPAAPAGSMRDDTGASREAPVAKSGAPREAADAALTWPQPAPPVGGRTRPPPSQQAVSAGMVDDNADFEAYLRFRARHPVAHRPLDIRERYLLVVRDDRGRPVPDAEIAVRASSGAATWARSDSSGRVWLHPNAFDDTGATLYEIAARKEGHFGRTILRRGQKSAAEVRLDGSSADTSARARLDLVFLVDATGSMGDEIAKLKATLHTIAGEVAALPSRPDTCFALVAYRDRGDAFTVRRHDFTNDLAAFQEALDALQARGGGDYPEALDEALEQTIRHLDWRGSGTTRLVVLLADAPPHLFESGPRYDQELQAALGKGIKIFGVGASGLDRQGEFIQRQMAQFTGGRFVFLTYRDAREPSSGPGRETVHDVRNYSVETLDRLIVRLVADELKNLPAGG